MSAPPAVVLAECTTMDGHRWSYARMYARVLRGLGFSVTHFCVPEDAARLDRVFREAGLEARARPLTWDLASRIGWRVWRFATRARLLRRGEIDHFWIRLFIQRLRHGLRDAPVLVPWISPALREGVPSALSALLPRHLIVLDGYLDAAFDPGSAPLYSQAEAILCLNEPAAAALGRPYRPWPDPVDESVTVEASSPFLDEIRRIAGERPIFLCPGISRRKHTVEFVRAARDAEPDAALWVVTGEPSTELRDAPVWRELVRIIPEHVQIREGACSDADLEGLFASAAAVFLCYCEHRGSSGMLTRAARHNTPALVSPGGLMANRVDAHRLGTVARTLEPQAVCDALFELAAEPYDREGARSYLERHSVDELKRELGELLRPWLPGAA